MKNNRLYSILLALAFSLSALFSGVTLAPEAAFAAQPQQPAKRLQKQTPPKAVHTGNYIIDQAGALKGGDLQKIDQILAAESQKSGAALCVAILNQGLDEKRIGAYANSFADKCAEVSGKGAIVFVQDIRSRKWYIATDKKMKPAFGKSDRDNKDHVEYISLEAVPHLKSNDLYAAYTTFAGKAGELAGYYNRTGEAMTVVDTTLEKIVIALMALAIGYIFASTRRSARIAAMSNVAAAAGAANYLDRSSFNLYASNDSYLYQTVAVVPRAKASENTRAKASENNGGCSFSSSNSGHGGGGGSY